jgi:hypothetical protein
VSSAAAVLREQRRGYRCADGSSGCPGVATSRYRGSRDDNHRSGAGTATVLVPGHPQGIPGLIGSGHGV